MEERRKKNAFGSKTILKWLVPVVKKGKGPRPGYGSNSKRSAFRGKKAWNCIGEPTVNNAFFSGGALEKAAGEKVGKWQAKLWGIAHEGESAKGRLLIKKFLGGGGWRKTKTDWE